MLARIPSGTGSGSGGSSDGAEPGWAGHIPVLAYVVAIKDAAAPGNGGLLQPLLKRWQAGGCSMNAFALPAVHAQWVGREALQGGSWRSTRGSLVHAHALSGPAGRCRAEAEALPTLALQNPPGGHLQGPSGRDRKSVV